MVDNILGKQMARYKHIDTSPRFLAVDLQRLLLPCQSASNTFHPSASNSFHFLRLLRAIFALLKAVGIVTRFQNIAMMGNTVK